MTIRGRRAGFALLLFILLAIPLFAQEAGPLKVVGSNAAGSIFKSAVEASGVEVALDYAFAGTQGGVSAFCQNQAGIVVTSRALTTAEVAACSANNVQFNEILFGIDGYALIASPDVDFVTCVTPSQLNALIAPSAVAEDTTWSALNATYPALPFGFVSMQAGTRAYDLLDAAINGDGFRADAGLTPNFEVILTTVAEGSGNLGLVPLSAALNATEDIRLLELNNAELSTCFAPSAANVLNRGYVGGERLFAYVNAAQVATTAGLTDALTAVLSPDNQAVLSAAGAVTLDETVAAQSLALLTSGSTGRVFSVDLDLFQPVANATGELRVGGSAAASSFVKSSLATFTQRNPSVTVTEQYLGAAAGARELCNGNLDFTIAAAALTEEEAAACAASEIVVVSFDLGVKNAVLIANSGNDALECLTFDAIKTAFTAGTEASDEYILFAQNKGDAALNLLVSTVNGVAAAARDEVNLNADPLYIGAAVGNVANGLAVVTLAQAEDIIADGYAVKLVGIDGGTGCVVPSAETFAAGTYPVAQTVALLVNQASLAADHVQAALWTILSNSNYANISAAGLVGLNIETLIAKRQALQALFAEADLIEAEKFAAEAAAAATAAFEATVTPGQTVVPTIDPNATLVPTAEPTIEEAVEPTVEATTEETTIEPTVEATTAP
jgi:phosphate transport system substrate-binding protein